MAAVLAVAIGCAILPAPAAENAPPAPPQFPSPFGPGHDPTRPPPEEPQTRGRGIVEAKLRAAGDAEIQERRADAALPKLAAVVLDIKIAGDSVTPILGRESVTARTEDGSTAMFAICTPTASGAPLSVFRRPYGRMWQWHVAVAGAAYECADGYHKLATQVAEGGVRLEASADWSGPLVLLFEAPAGSLRKVTIPGAEVELPPSKDGEATKKD